MSKKFIPDVGFGAVYKNDGKGPSYKGYVREPEGILGLALWKKETRDGDVYYSVSIDDREGKYHAEKFDLPHVDSGKDDRDSRPRDRDERSSRGRDDDRRGSDRDDRRTSRRDDDDHDREWRNEDRGSSRRGKASDDMDDEIPWK